MMLLCCCCCCCCFCLWSFVSFVPSMAKPTTHQTLDRVPPMRPHTPAMRPQTPASQTMESLSILSPDQVSASNSSNSTSECVQIMGHSEQDELKGAQIFYPCMQCADIFFLKPVRDHFKNDLTAKELLKRVKGYKVTR